MTRWFDLERAASSQPCDLECRSEDDVRPERKARRQTADLPRRRPLTSQLHEIGGQTATILFIRHLSGQGFSLVEILRQTRRVVCQAGCPRQRLVGIPPVERPKVRAVAKAGPCMTHRLLSTADERLDTRGLPVADGQIFIGAVGSVDPVKDRRLVERHHHPVVRFAPIGLYDQVPGPIETPGREMPVGCHEIDVGLIDHESPPELNNRPVSKTAPMVAWPQCWPSRPHAGR